MVEAIREGCGKFGEDVGRHGRHFLSGLLVFGSQGLESVMEYVSCIGCHVEAFKLILRFGLGGDEPQDFEPAHRPAPGTLIFDEDLRGQNDVPVLERELADAFRQGEFGDVQTPVLGARIRPEVIVDRRILALGKEHEAVGNAVLRPDDGKFVFLFKGDREQRRSSSFLDFFGKPVLGRIGDPGFADVTEEPFQALFQLLGRAGVGTAEDFFKNGEGHICIVSPRLLAPETACLDFYRFSAL